jgi:hypothetical protein
MKGPVNKLNQLGMSSWAWLIFIVLMVGAGTAALKVGPHYIDFRVVQSVADRLDENKVHQDMSRGDIAEHFQKQFRVESIYTPVKDVISIQRDRQKTVLNIDYEVREHLFYNIDVVLTFNDVRTYQ